MKVGRKSIHGMANTRFYNIYLGMKQRCYSLNSIDYKNYGGRGIKVCDRWLGEDGFIHFKEDMYDSYLEHVAIYGEADTTIDRINTDNGYCKENCRWATRKEQNNNTRHNRVVVYNDKELTVSECVEKYGNNKIPYTLVLNRLNKGWSIEDAMFKDIRDKPKLYNYNDEMLSLSEILNKYGDCRIDYFVDSTRLRKGWSMDRAISEIPMYQRRYGKKIKTIKPFTFKDDTDNKDK